MEAKNEFKQDFNIDELNEENLQDEVSRLKLWLFRENVRIEADRHELDELYKKFMKEKGQFQKEVRELRRKLELEQSRVREEKSLCEQKLQVLENAYRQLDLDRKALEREKRMQEADREYLFSQTDSTAGEEFSFFHGVNSSLALKKRYKDLIKIYHPDNMCGDKSTFQMIQREYDCLDSLYSNKWKKQK